MQSGSALSARGVLTLAAAQLGFGLLTGALIALAARWFLQFLTFEVNGFDAVFMLAVALLSYALPTYIGGNGYLSAYLVGIILGNSPMPNKKGLV